MSPVMYLVGWSLIHFVWQGAALALATTVALRLCSRPATRYVVACLGLAAMLGAPLATLAAMATSRATDIVVTADDAATSTAIARADRTVPTPPATVASGLAPLVSMRGTVTGSRLMAALVIGWMAGVALLFGRLAMGWRQVKRLQQRALSQPSSRWLAAGQRIAGLMGLSHVPHIVDSTLVDVPTVVGWLRPLILLPVAALANLTPAQVDSILAHELAHVRRHDYLANLLQTLAETLLFYHPAVWWVSARIRAEREHCCDEIAVEVCGDAASYARALVELESWRISAPTVALAATGGPLFDRVRRIMRAPATGASRQSGWIAIIALVVFFTAGAGAVNWLHATAESTTRVEMAQTQLGPSGTNLVSRAHLWLVRMTRAHVRLLHRYLFGSASSVRAATAQNRSEFLTVARNSKASLSLETLEPLEPPEAPEPPEPPEPLEAQQAPAPAERQAPPVPATLRASGSWSSSRGEAIFDSSFLCFGIPCAQGTELRVRGTLGIKPDLTDVESLSDGGYLELRMWSFFIPHTIEIRSEGGSLTHRYFVGGLWRRYDDEARRMLADALPSLVRRSGLGAVSRTQQILAARGAIGVLDEIALLESDFARSLYFRALFDATRLDPPTMARALTMAGDVISSDFERSRTSRSVASVAAADVSVTKAYVATTNRMSSDFERGRVLLALLQADGGTPAVREMVAQSASHLQSDFEKSRVLRSLVTSGPPAFPGPLFVAVRSMSSDFEKSRVLRQLLANRDLPVAAKQGVLDAVPSMSSDYEQSRVLRAMLDSEPLDPALRPAFVGAAEHIGSSFEQNRVLAALVKGERR